MNYILDCLLFYLCNSLITLTLLDKKEREKNGGMDRGVGGGREGGGWRKFSGLWGIEKEKERERERGKEIL